MLVTLITKYDGKSADTFAAVIEGEISPEIRQQMRVDNDCDGQGPTSEDDCDASNLFFREMEIQTLDSVRLLNVDAD